MKDAFTYDVAEFRQGCFQPVQTTVIQEIPLTIYLNGHEIITLLSTGKEPGFLAVGFLKCNGLITDRSQLKKIHVKEDSERLEVYVEAGQSDFGLTPAGHSTESGWQKGKNFKQNVKTLCSKKVTENLIVTPEQLLRLAEGLSERSVLYRITGGCHNSLLATPEKIVLFHQDIGRHNAIDMICGQCFLDRISAHDKLIVTTGRVTSEILLKVIRIGVPVLASISAATRLAIELARKTNMTLVGRLKQERIVVYSNGGRIAGL